MNPTQTTTPPQPQAPADPSQFGNYSNWAQEQMSKGFTPDQLHQSLAQNGITVQQPHSGNWFTHLLPTLGSIAVPALGALLAPETGGLSLVAAAGLSGLGAAGGKAAEDVTEGKGIGKDVLTEGLQGAAGGAVGGIAGKVLGKGAEYLGSRAAGITDDAAQAAAQQGAQDAQLAEAQATRNNFGGLKPGVQAANNLEGNQSLLKEWGLDHTSPEAMGTASKGGLYLNDIDQAALGAGKPIKTTDLISSRDITTATPEEQQALSSPKVGVISEEGKLNPTVTPQQAHAFAQELNAQMRDLSMLADNAKAAGNVSDYKLAKQQLNDLTTKYQQVQKLASTPEVNAAISTRTVTPEEKQSLVEQFGQKQADYLEQKVNEAQTHQDLVAAKAPFAQMNDLSGLALNDMKAAGTARALARAKTDINGDGVADANAPLTPSLTDSLKEAFNGSVSGSPTTVVAKALYHSKDNPAILQTLSRIGKLGSKLAPATGTTMALAGGMGADPAAMGAGGTMGGMMNTNANSTMGGGDNSINSILNRYMYMGTVDPYLLSATSPVVQALAPEAQKNQMLGGELAAMPAAFANAGGAQGEGGIMSRISAMIPGTAANQYEKQRQAVAAQLGASMGISPQAALGLLPQVMNSPGTAGISQGILAGIGGHLGY